MLKLLLCGLLTLVAFVLYCCIRCSSEYDRELDDMEQEEYLKNRKIKSQ